MHVNPQRSLFGVLFDFVSLAALVRAIASSQARRLEYASFR